MPELPDISAYLAALEARILGQPLVHIRLASPFLLRTVKPPVTASRATPFNNYGVSASESRSASTAIFGWFSI